MRARREPRLTSIIIPSLNELEPLRRLLESIDRCCMAYRYEIIIADGGSGDGRLLNYYDLLEKNKAARIAKAARRASARFAVPVRTWQWAMRCFS